MVVNRFTVMGNRAGGGARGGGGGAGGGAGRAFSNATRGMSANQKSATQALMGITGRSPKEAAKMVKTHWDLTDRYNGGKFNAKTYANDIFSFEAFQKP